LNVEELWPSATEENMVKSSICPVCLADIPGEYIEEGDIRIANEAISCPYCGYILEGVVDECPECEESEKERGAE